MDDGCIPMATLSSYPRVCQGEPAKAAASRIATAFLAQWVDDAFQTPISIIELVWI